MKGAARRRRTMNMHTSRQNDIYRHSRGGDSRAGWCDDGVQLARDWMMAETGSVAFGLGRCWAWDAAACMFVRDLFTMTWRVGWGVEFCYVMFYTFCRLFFLVILLFWIDCGRKKFLRRRRWFARLPVAVAIVCVWSKSELFVCSWVGSEVFRWVCSGIL